jgi:hypothetical protein
MDAMTNLLNLTHTTEKSEVTSRSLIQKRAGTVRNPQPECFTCSQAAPEYGWFVLVMAG